MKINYKCFLASLTVVVLLTISNLTTTALALPCCAPPCVLPPLCAILCTSGACLHTCDGIHWTSCGSGSGSGGKNIGNLAPDDVPAVAPVTPSGLRGPRRGPAATVRFQTDGVDDDN